MIQPPDTEKAVGMEAYATDTPPCQDTLRAELEDFRVEEVTRGFEMSSEPRPGYFPLYRVEKRSVDTLHAERELASALKSRIAHAGLKDKRAAAVQFMTPTSSRSERPAKVEGRGFNATLVGYLPRPISRSMVAGNVFRIVLRNCCLDVGERIELALGMAASLRIPNFFGLQRFGSRGSLTHVVGRSIVRRDFRGAVSSILFEPRSTDDEVTREARRLMSEGRYSEGYELLPPYQDVERMVARHLSRKPEDLLGAIRSVPIAVRRLYVQAYQSFLLNKTLSLALQRGIDISKPVPGDNWGELSSEGLNVAKVHGVKEPMTPRAVPLAQLVGYAYRNYGSRFDLCAEEVMAAEGVAPRDFFVKEMQEVSVEGGFRRPHLAVQGARSQVSGDSAELEFTLPRGGYATVLLREIIKPSDPTASGFA